MKKIIFGGFAVFGLIAAQAEGVPLVPEGATALHSISSKAANTSTDVWASNQVGPYLQIYNADNSKFILQADDTVEAKFKFNETGRGACIFCDRTSGSAGKFNFMRTGDAKGRFDYGTENNTFTSPSINDTSKHTIVASGKSLKIDGTAVTIASSTYVPSSNALLIFCCDNSGNGIANNGNTGSITMYYFRVKDGSGNVRLNLVPMKDANGVVGMYDQVSGKFFGSGNTYTFTAGSAATEEDIAEYFLPQPDEPVDPPHTHVWGEWVTTKEPQVGVPGEKQRTCSGCDEVETEVIPALPEPAAADATLDFSSTAKSIRPALHGCGVAPRTRALGKSNETQILKDAGFYSCRAHDLALHDGAQAIVDFQQIFPLFSKDPDDPASYRFEPTDRVMAAITNAGMKIIFRLGSCGQSRGDDNDHEYYNNIFTPSSANYDKIAAVFSKIIAHYNEGWNHGFNLGIEYWEIWNEPDADPGNRWPSNSAATEFPQFFAKVVKKVKTDHPSVKIGGPASFQLNTSFFDNCLSACNTAGVCPDFYTFHYYSHYCGAAKDPADLTTAVENMRSHLASKTCAGKSCADIEIGVTEWNYYSGPSTEWYGRLTMEGAAWCAGVAQDLQYSTADFSNWYGAGWNASFGIYNGRDGVLSKTYYSLKMVGQVVKNYTKLAARTDTDTLHVLGAVNDAGTKGCIMVTERTTTARNFTVGLDGFAGKTLSNIKCYVTDGTRDMAEISTGFTLQANAPDAVTFAKGATQSVWLITFDIAE